jgi:hypothetical protein
MKTCEADIIDGASQGHKQCRVVKVEGGNVGEESVASITKATVDFVKHWNGGSLELNFGVSVVL